MESLHKRVAVEAVKYFAGIPRRKWADSLENLDVEQFWDYQAILLSRRYADAKARVPYYRDSDLYPHELPQLSTPLEMLGHIPVLPKDSVKSSPVSFRREPRNAFSWSHTTGGTTGSPLRIYAGLFERGSTNAILEWRNKQATGRRNPSVVRLSGYLTGEHADVGLKVPLTDTAYLSIYALSEKRKHEVVNFLRETRPQVIHGYASALGQLANLVTADELGLGPLTVLSTSETLDESTRVFIESRLNATVYNEYGSQEGQHLVLECSFRNLHIHPGRGVVELLSLESDRPAVVGELGRVVVSGLLSREMPLLRYNIGDSAISNGYIADCSCGLLWPTIGSITGRTEDLVRTRDGRRIGLISHSTLKDLSGILESQVRQKGFSEFEYMLLLDSTANMVEIEDHVKKSLEARIGEPVSLNFIYVDRPLPRTAAGKLKAVVVDF